MELCRSCMSEEKTNLQPLFKTKDIPRIYNTLTLLNISHDDGLSKWLCTCCINILNSFNLFKEQCIQSDKVLKDRLNKIIEENNSEACAPPVKVEEIYQIDLEPDYSIGNDDNDTDIFGDNMDDNTHNESDDFTSDNDEISLKNEHVDTKPCLQFENETPFKQEIKHEESMDGDSNDSNDNLEVPVPKPQKKRKPFKPGKITIEYDKHKNYSFPFRCNICDRGFHYKERLDGHLREHEGKRAAVCEICGNDYTWSGLKQHIKLVHKDRLKFNCDKCSKSFIHESALMSHKVKHEGPRKYICDQCGKSCHDLYSLKKHNLSHTDETPFECNECGKKFKSDPHLRAHQFRHKGIKRFACPECTKPFTTRPELRTHMAVHSEVKQFHCVTCDKSFRQKSQLSAHKKCHLW